jgi:RNA polymerase sigma-32 factor
MGRYSRNSTSDGIDRYITRVLAMPKQDRDRESVLARAFAHGDRVAGNELLTANLRHVVPHALRYRFLGPSLSELVAQGNLGLLRALQTFDPERGVRFASYANPWIRAEMLGIVLRSRTMVGGGRGVFSRKYVFGMRREHGRLAAQLGDEDAVYRCLAERYRMPVHEISAILRRLELYDASLETPEAEDGTGRTLLDRLSAGDDGADESAVAPAERDQIASAVGEALAVLNDRERYIVQHRLMADEEARLSLSDIGERFAVSRERARQIEQAAKAKLRARLRPLAQRFELAV